MIDRLNQNYKILFSLCLLTLPYLALSQTVEFASYNTTSRTTTYITVSVYDTTQFGYTDWNYGSYPGFALLSLLPPANPFPNAGFTDLMPVSSLYSISDYPVRTAIRLGKYKNDTLKIVCSGILVGKYWVLTSAHCINSFYGSDTAKFTDSIVVTPAFDKKNVHPEFGESPCAAYYVPKSVITDDNIDQDVALIRLDSALGTKTGWVGIAFSNDTGYYRGKVFHKFSYPGQRSFDDTTKIYNGDTLYYNYGTLDVISPVHLGFNVGGVLGQSGSSLMYTDNTAYYSFGTLTFAHNSLHIRFDQKMFAGLKNIMLGNIAGVDRPNVQPEKFVLFDPYPNPFNPATIVEYYMPRSEFVSIKVMNSVGQEVAVISSGVREAGRHRIVWNAENLSSGVYFFLFQSEEYSVAKKIILLK